MNFVFDNGNVHALSTGDRWTPILKGDVFCSPACGCGCKKANYDQANELAQAIAKQLGGGWEPHVWENCGWNSEVTKGAATVSLESDGQYSARIQFLFAADHIHHIEEFSPDPRHAVDAVIAAMQKKIALINRALMSVSLDVIEIEYAVPL